MSRVPRSATMFSFRFKHEKKMTERFGASKETKELKLKRVVSLYLLQLATRGYKDSSTPGSKGLLTSPFAPRLADNLVKMWVIQSGMLQKHHLTLQLRLQPQ